MTTTTSTAQLVEPTSDPFYIVPSNISDYAAGEVVRSRKVETLINGTTSYQLFYRTNNQTNGADGTVATVWVPPNPRNRIISYHFPEDATNLDCAPSWIWVAPDKTNNTFDNRLFIEARTVVPYGLLRGAYVVNPDAEGSKSAWQVGHVEGQASLDALRATMNFFKIKRKAKIGFYGYSGGAHQVAWASSLAASYAPELNVVGAAFGGTPVDLRATYTLQNASPQASFAGPLIYGLANGYPNVNTYLASHETAQGKKIAAELRSNDFCVSTDGSVFDNFNFSALYDTDIFAAGTPFSKVLDNESLLMNVSSRSVSVPKFPRFQYHSSQDETVPYAPEAQYVQQQCAHGANIKFVSFPELNHAETEVTGLTLALAFLTAAFVGNLTLPVNCGAPTFLL